MFAGNPRWNEIPVTGGTSYAWNPGSTYVQEPPYFRGLEREPAPIEDIRGARVLVSVGDSVTTDHISPAGDIAAGSPAARYLEGHGLTKREFNSYGARRGNHEVMMRGTFANIRLKNLLVPGSEGNVTVHFPSGEPLSIFDASERYRAAGTPLCVLAGKEYGTGSSRDWAAKGPLLLGVRFVIAESFERIHRSNLAGMGVLPLQYKAGETAKSLGLTGEGDVRGDGDRRGALAAAGGPGHGHPRRRHADRVPDDRPARHAGRGELLPERRHPADRRSPARGRQPAGLIVPTEGRAMFAEFRNFLLKTNAMALAIGVIIGAAIGKVVGLAGERRAHAGDQPGHPRWRLARGQDRAGHQPRRHGRRTRSPSGRSWATSSTS